MSGVARRGTRERSRAFGWRLDAWRSFLRAHNFVLVRLERDLQAAVGMPLASYDVLVQLAEAPQERLRMHELAEAVLLSRSGLTRLVDRMQRQGLVRREPDPGDGRGLSAVLMPAGRAALREASAVHLAGVSELVLQRLTDEELRQLHHLMNKIAPSTHSRSPAGSDPVSTPVSSAVSPAVSQPPD